MHEKDQFNPLLALSIWLCNNINMSTVNFYTISQYITSLKKQNKLDNKNPQVWNS